MWLEFISIGVGLALLMWSADYFIDGAAALARNLGMSPLVIGLTIVSFGTSAPEILVSLTAALQGNPGLALGNAVGSNIANIGLILGITALISPLTISSRALIREYPILVVISSLALLMVLDHKLERYEGLLMLFLLVFVLWLILRIARSESTRHDPVAAEYEVEIPKAMPTSKALFWLGFSLITLLVASKILVWGAIAVAAWLGVSDLVIGLTIIALGTSLPELATTLASALKGEPDLAFGNVIGSNLFNLLAVFSLPGIVHPTFVSAFLLERDMPAMLAITLAIVGVAWTAGDARRINRYGGALLLLSYLVYQSWVIYTTLK